MRSVLKVVASRMNFIAHEPGLEMAKNKLGAKRGLQDGKGNNPAEEKSQLGTHSATRVSETVP